MRNALIRAILLVCIAINIYTLRYCNASLEEPIFVMDNNPSFFGHAEISLEDNSNVKFFGPLVNKTLLFDGYDDIGQTYYLNLINYKYFYSKLNDNYRIFKFLYGPVVCTLMKKKEEQGVGHTNEHTNTDIVRNNIIKFYDANSAADLIFQLTGCLHYSTPNYIFRLCLNSHARITTDYKKKDSQEEFITGVMGTNTKDYIINNTSFIHVVSNSGIGVSYIKQVYKNGNRCKNSDSYKHTHLYLSCNPYWEGIYNLHIIDNCKYVVYAYSISLCKYQAFVERNHDIKKIKKGENTFFCSSNVDAGKNFDYLKLHEELPSVNYSRMLIQNIGNNISYTVEPKTLKELFFTNISPHNQAALYTNPI